MELFRIESLVCSQNKFMFDKTVCMWNNNVIQLFQQVQLISVILFDLNMFVYVDSVESFHAKACVTTTLPLNTLKKGLISFAFIFFSEYDGILFEMWPTQLYLVLDLRTCSIDSSIQINYISITRKSVKWQWMNIERDLDCDGALLTHHNDNDVHRFGFFFLF